MITFSDASLFSSSEMIEAVTALYRVNMVNGYDDGTFRPQNTLSNAEAATMLSYLDCREYNNDHTIVVYVKSTTGKAVPNAAVYVVPADSNSSIAYTPVLSLADPPGRGIARYEGLNKNETYGINVFGTLIMVPVQDLKSPQRKYVFVTLPEKVSYATDIPIPGYTRGHWAHNSAWCTEPRWAFSGSYCPTRQRKLNQNFGWRYMSEKTEVG